MSGFRARLATIYGVLAILNVVAWLWAFAAFHDKPILLSVSLLIYGLGLRHAVDPDHIAAIDNVTRKLMHEGKRPVSVGFFFAAGHSAIVMFMTAAVAEAATMLGDFQSFRDLGGTIGTTVSAAFLFAIAAMNVMIFISIHQNYRRVRLGGANGDEDLDILLKNRGFLARIFQPLFRLVTKSWHMLLLGFMFGLGFDTATEVTMFSMSIEEAGKGVPFVSILVFPILFAAGMSLLDTTDGVAMVGVYNWAFVRPMRKLWYNMMITLLSVVVALVIGGIEALGVIGDKLGLRGTFWGEIADANVNFNDLGFVIIGVFLVVWALSWLVYHIRRIDALEVRAAE